jgi:tetratricopeptide (TPR) repeat protein
MTGTHFSLEEIRCIDRLACEGKWEQALSLFQKALVWSSNQGQESAFLHWKTAVCLDMTNSPLEAYTHIERATNIEAFNIHYQKSKDVILNNLENFFIFHVGKKSDYDLIRKVYKIIQKNGCLNDNIRVEYARYIGAQGKVEKASLLLERVLSENPNHAEAHLLAELFELEKHKNAVSMNISKKAQ